MYNTQTQGHIALPMYLPLQNIFVSTVFVAKFTLSNFRCDYIPELPQLMRWSALYRPLIFGLKNGQVELRIHELSRPNHAWGYPLYGCFVLALMGNVLITITIAWYVGRVIFSIPRSIFVGRSINTSSYGKRRDCGINFSMPRSIFMGRSINMSSYGISAIVVQFH